MILGGAILELPILGDPTAAVAVIDIPGLEAALADDRPHAQYNILPHAALLDDRTHAVVLVNPLHAVVQVNNLHAKVPEG